MTTIPHRWDIFTRIVDNFGDAGVSWRLARQLANEHRLDVTLWLDLLGPLVRIAPGIVEDKPSQRAYDVTVRRWDEPFPVTAPADVVIEAFGCGLPESYVASMAAREVPPQWFVLEYLSAEPWIDGVHARASPHPALALPRRFWFPGFTPDTGGLLHERGLFTSRDAFQSDCAVQRAWWANLGIPARSADETRVSLFCYPNPALPALLDAWSESDAPIVCVVPEGIATGALDQWSEGALPHVGGPPLSRGRLSLHVVPFVGQDDYDKLLWGCDVNFVRGEDSFARAQWAARPFVWHLYPQSGHGQLAKLDAFLDRYGHRLDTRTTAAVGRLSRAWNGAPDAGPIAPAWLEFAGTLDELRIHGTRWATQLEGLQDLAGGLVMASWTEV